MGRKADFIWKMSFLAFCECLLEIHAEGWVRQEEERGEGVEQKEGSGGEGRGERSVFSHMWVGKHLLKGAQQLWRSRRLRHGNSGYHGKQALLWWAKEKPYVKSSSHVTLHFPAF